MLSEAETASLLTVEQEPLAPARVSSEGLLEVARLLYPKTPQIMTCVVPSIQNNSFALRPFPSISYMRQNDFVTTRIIHNGRDEFPEVRR